MRYLKRYNEITLLKNLNKEELRNYEYIIGDTTLNESLSSMLDRLKTIGRKTALTATLLTTLMSNPAFSKEYNKLSEPEKKEIQSLVKDKTDKDKTTEFGMNSEFITVKLGGLFESGQYEIDESKDIDEINKIKDFINNNKGKKLLVKISASESRVPNVGVNMKTGELAEKRFENIKKFIQENIGDEISFIKDVKIGGPKYIGDDVDQEKYKKHQFVNVTISLDIWNFQDDFEGKQSSEELGYIGKKYKFFTENLKGTGNLLLSTGRIPDRAKVFLDGVLVGDTGYFTDTKPEIGYKLVPLYVLELTKKFRKSPNTDAFKGVKTIKIKSKEELKDIIFDKNTKPVSKFDRTELEKAYYELESYADNIIKTDGYIDIVVYDNVAKDIKININKQKSLKIEVYSPIGKTGFKISVKMDGERLKNI